MHYALKDIIVETVCLIIENQALSKAMIIMALIYAVIAFHLMSAVYVLEDLKQMS